MEADTVQAKVLAQAVYELRLLLASYLGSDCDAPPHLRQAAHLAYALHNQAEAVLAGQSFDVEAALASIGAFDRFLGSNYRERFRAALHIDEQP